MLIKISKRFEKLIMKKNSLQNLIIQVYIQHLIKIFLNCNFWQSRITISHRAFRSISPGPTDNFSAYCLKMLYK